MNAARLKLALALASGRQSLPFAIMFLPCQRHEMRYPEIFLNPNPVVFSEVSQVPKRSILQTDATYATDSSTTQAEKN
jgi:hypothetical protein